jgi:catechol 2,3-dioxygenase-like lactoylglutathione lyase family enzyme
MSTTSKPHIECEQHHATLSVNDVRAAAEFYTNKLGFVLAFAEGDPPTFAGVNLDHVQIFLSKGTPAPQGCSVYFVVGDADQLFEFHRANGVEIVESPKDQPYKLREYTVRDLDGYYLNFGHRLPRQSRCPGAAGAGQ